MHQSDINPRVVTKNLEDIIKQSTFSTKRNSIDDVVKCQRSLYTEPRNKNIGEKNQRCKTNTFNQQSDQKNNLSMSKHSLSSKEKIKFHQVDKFKTKPSPANNPCHKKVSTLACSEIDKLKENQTVPKQLHPSHQNQSLYFNHVDAIFTELEDFLRETRENVLTNIDQQIYQQPKQSNNGMAKEMEELFLIFKEQLERLIQKYTKTQKEVVKQNIRKQKQERLTRQNENKQRGKNKSNLANRTKEDEKKNFLHSNFNQISEIESFMQRQNTLNSTILPDEQQDDEYEYLATETDTELLSMLVLKNKFNNTKRKFINPGNSSPQYSIISKQGKTKKQGSQGEYSFRNKHLFESITQPQSKNTAINCTEKKKNLRKSTSESQNKQNRQKSIYELVLEQNRRQKIGVCK